MKTANVSKLKAQLAHYLRMVKAGQKVRVIDRNLAIADIVPIADDLMITKAEHSTQSFFKNLPLTGEGATDSLAILLQDRSSR